MADEKEKIDSKLLIALNARKKKRNAENRISELKKEEEQAKEKARKKAEERKKAEKAKEKFKDEKEILLKIADIKPESKSSRIHFAGQGFFDLLNKFDTDADGNIVENGEFSKKYNSLNIEDVAKAVIKCSKYFPNNGSNPNITIFGNALNDELDRLIEEREKAIAEAKEKLDIEWKKVLQEEAEKAKNNKNAVKEENADKKE